MTSMARSRGVIRFLSAAAAVITLATVLVTAPARSQAATAGDTNPLAGSWGSGAWMSDGVYPAYEAATGTRKRLLGKVALRPRVRWFGAWYPTKDVASLVRGYIANVQDGDPDAVP